MLLLTTDKELENAKHLIEKYKTNQITKDEIRKNPKLNNDLWTAQTKLNAIIHPQTGEKIFIAGRMSCFVPMNVPIAAGFFFVPFVVFFVPFFVFFVLPDICVKFFFVSKFICNM